MGDAALLLLPLAAIILSFGIREARLMEKDLKHLNRTESNDNDEIFGIPAKRRSERTNSTV